MRHVYQYQKERALGAGFFNAGANIGAILTPLIVTLITIHLGLSWRFCFIATGAAGLLWLIPWLWLYRSPQTHPRLSPAELAHIRSDPPDAVHHIPWLNLLRFRATWAFIIGLSLTSPIWFFYLYWLPDFLAKSFHLDLRQQQWPIIVVYLISDAGSIAGGWLSSMLIHRGYSVLAGRKLAMLACAICVLPVFFAPRAADMWTATLLVALAAAAHQGWASNLFTFVSDTLPGCAVSSVAGMGGMTAGLVAILFQEFSGHLLQSRHAGAYVTLFAICSSTYLIALLCIHLLVPRLPDVPDQRA